MPHTHFYTTTPCIIVINFIFFVGGGAFFYTQKITIFYSWGVMTTRTGPPRLDIKWYVCLLYYYRGVGDGLVHGLVTA